MNYTTSYAMTQRVIFPDPGSIQAALNGEDIPMTTKTTKTKPATEVLEPTEAVVEMPVEATVPAPKTPKAVAKSTTKVVKSTPKAAAEATTKAVKATPEATKTAQKRVFKPVRKVIQAGSDAVRFLAKKTKAAGKKSLGFMKHSKKTTPAEVAEVANVATPPVEVVAPA